MLAHNVPNYMVAKRPSPCRDTMQQHSHKLIRRLLVRSRGDHELHLELLCPRGNVLDKVDSVPPRVLLQESRILDAHRIADGFPKCTQRAHLHICQPAPFPPVDPGNGLGDKHTEGVQEVLVRDLAGLDKGAVEGVDAPYGLMRALGVGAVGDELADENGCVFMALAG